MGTCFNPIQMPVLITKVYVWQVMNCFPSGALIIIINQSFDMTITYYRYLEWYLFIECTGHHTSDTYIDIHDKCSSYQTHYMDYHNFLSNYYILCHINIIHIRNLYCRFSLIPRTIYCEQIMKTISFINIILSQNRLRHKIKKLPLSNSNLFNIFTFSKNLENRKKNKFNIM